MHRRQLLEIEDQPWCPAVLRDHVTAYLQFLIDLATPYAAVVPLLREALGHSGDKRVLDLASGAGGPWLQLRHQLARRGCPVSVTLSDKYPNAVAATHLADSGQDGVRYFPEPIDAAHVPPELPGFRTIFSSFHHFPPAQARAVLQDAVEQNRGIAVFEALERSPLCLLLACLNGLLVFALTPFIRPFRWSRLLWTYLLPVIPFIVIVDGLASCLRAYTPAEMLELSRNMKGRNYRWQAGVARGGAWPLPVSYLIGYPEAEAAEKGRRLES